ncbi:hypothetical protein HanRHA438_Chr16g0780171 [Helianthus annuus]|nr:hypothetical protein HanRHA438_Chr16g0780171 [Helianthus annuus]
MYYDENSQTKQSGQIIRITMSSWGLDYIFGDYSNESYPNESYVSESKIEHVVERGEEEVASVVRCNDGFQVPDLNQEYADEPESYPQYQYPSYHSHADVKHENEYEYEYEYGERVKHIEEDDNGLEEDDNDFEEDDNGFKEIP